MMDSNISKKHLLRKVYTQKEVNLKILRDQHLNLRDAKYDSLSHISMDYRKENQR